MWRPDGPTWVVEPHADDAHLSLGWHLQAWTRLVPVTIVTVYSATRHRRADALRYAAHVGAEWVGLGHTEGGSIDAVAAPFEAADFEGLGDSPGDTVVWPLGLRHGEHVAVAAARPPGALAYLDQPYATVGRNADACQAALAGRTVVGYLHPPTRKWQANALFKDQRLYFHRHGPQLDRCCEMLVR